ncbi:MAG: ATP-dependent DNA helicase RecG [Bacilli bacterium]|nr:ATP-dependent DNA helicase RecG [Bacilli bacterium]
MDKLTKSPRLNYLLGQMGIFTYYDVINHLPHRYDDYSYTDETNIQDKQRVVLFGKVISIPKVIRTKGVTIATFDFMSQNRRYYKVVFFNQPYLNNSVKIDGEYSIIGTFNLKRNEVDGQKILKGEVPAEERLKPVYSLPKEFQNYLFAKLALKALNELQGKIYPLVPYDYINKYRLVNKEVALNWAHHPTNYQEVTQALRHLKYEEALLFSLKNQLIRENNKSLSKIRKEPIDLDICKPFLDALPYKLTEDQRKASEEIINDMNQNALMYRLLQGDVGTGKTLVSFVALYANSLRGDQGALMAPTDALARQHYANALKTFKDTKLKIALLLGSTPTSEKKQIKDDLKEGYIDIIIGTHALFSKDVQYSSLGLVVIDEQHRFGVNQRIALANKGDHADLLMMSATPIPRSLALTLYGDLDISTLYTFPSTKRDVKTMIFKSDNERIFKAVDYALTNDKQVYVIAPLIDFSEDCRFSVEQLYAKYAFRYRAAVGLLHGKMKQEEKEEILDKFYKNEIKILVSTQVVEVGIDVKNANTMVIYDATHFGLASLHQLRGRIGRDGSPSYCILVSNDEEANKLDILTKSEDGFVIAEEDMKQRGPGELTGLKQSGIPDFAFLNIIDDYKIFVVARDDAKEIIKNKEDKKYQWLIKHATSLINQEDIKKA